MGCLAASDSAHSWPAAAPAGVTRMPNVPDGGQATPPGPQGRLVLGSGAQGPMSASGPRPAAAWLVLGSQSWPDAMEPH